MPLGRSLKPYATGEATNLAKLPRSSVVLPEGIAALIQRAASASWPPMSVMEWCHDVLVEATAHVPTPPAGSFPPGERVGSPHRRWGDAGKQTLQVGLEPELRAKIMHCAARSEPPVSGTHWMGQRLEEAARRQVAEDVRQALADAGIGSEARVERAVRALFERLGVPAAV